MRNKGQFLTRRLAIETLEPPPAKRQKFDSSLAGSSGSLKFIEYDCYPSRNSFNRKEIVELGTADPSRPPERCVLWLEKEVDFEILEKLKVPKLKLALVRQN